MNNEKAIKLVKEFEQKILPYGEDVQFYSFVKFYAENGDNRLIGIGNADAMTFAQLFLALEERIEEFKDALEEARRIKITPVRH